MALTSSRSLEASRQRNSISELTTQLLVRTLNPLPSISESTRENWGLTSPSPPRVVPKRHTHSTAPGPFVFVFPDWPAKGFWCKPPQASRSPVSSHGRRSRRGHDSRLAWELDPGTQRLPHLRSQCPFCPPSPHEELGSRTRPAESNVS